MKRYILAMAVMISYSYGTAQTAFDAQKFTQSDINGTARYMGMAGAFGALGGDASAIKDNPAGLGIYRRSEITGTFNALLQQSEATWKDELGRNDMYKTGINNLSFVIASPTYNSETSTSGLQSSNWGFSYNRLKNFDRAVTIKSQGMPVSMTDYMTYFSNGFLPTDLGYDNFSNENVPWISILGYESYLIDSVDVGAWSSLLSSGEFVNPSYTLTESGSVNEYAFSWAGNFSNVFYLGASLNLQSINYLATSVYDESFDLGGTMQLANTLRTDGVGMNLKLGTIIRPTDFLRFGLSIHTPTVFAMTDTYSSSMSSDVTGEKLSISPSESPYSDYQLQNPLELEASAALIIGKKGILSAQYDYTKYTSMRLLGADGDSYTFMYPNDDIRSMMNDVSTIRIGGEYRLSDNFSLRAGYANMSPTVKPETVKYLPDNSVRTDPEYFIRRGTDFISLGFGYREADWFFDLAYVNKVSHELFYPYNHTAVAVPNAVVKNNYDNVVMTLGFKF